MIHSYCRMRANITYTAHAEVKCGRTTRQGLTYTSVTTLKIGLNQKRYLRERQIFGRTDIIVLKADKPDGKFTVHSEGTITPPDWESLDGTLYISKSGKPYMIFCHEWVQINDGEMCAIEMSADLKRAVGEPILLFKASEASWIAEAQKNKGIYVTDGPFPYRCADGTLLLLWSSMGEEGYTEAIAVSDNGDIDGNWVQRDELLFKKDGGHGMIFKTFDDKLLLLLHSPNKHPLERPAYFELEDKNGMLYVK